MKLSAIISEYNPFHNGHKYQVERVKRETNNAVAAIMSGSFTQRGSAAIYDKFDRCVAALRNGVDLVIELPTVYSLSPAENFAKGGVKTAEALGITDRLCFGTETDDLESLEKAAELFFEESFNNEIKRCMDNGDYYPKAVEKALYTVSPNLGGMVSGSNNILAIEYLKAIKGTAIKPHITKRIGAEHDEKAADGIFTSACHIRELIEKNSDYSVFTPELYGEDFALTERLEKALFYKLRTMPAEKIAELPEVNEGLENRIIEAVKTGRNLGELCESIKTKRYTMARIRRILISALLGITAESANQNPSYIRVLGFNDTGAELLSQIKKHSSLPVIVNVADGYKKLDEIAKKTFDIDIAATDIHSLAFKRIRNSGRDFTNGIIKI